MSTAPVISEDHDEVARRWIQSAWRLAGALAVVSVAYAFAVDYFVLVAEAGNYRGHWRAPYYLARVDGYQWFLPLASLASATWALALVYRRRLGEIFGEADEPSGPLRSTTAAAVGFGVVALAAYYSHREWLYYEMQCWDGYCDHADMFAAWFTGEVDASAKLLDYARTDYHANSLLVPMLSGAFSFGTGLSAETAYRALCSVASLGTLVIVARSLMPGTGVDAKVRFPALVLLATHMFWVRSFVFPQTDAFVMFWVTALAALALDEGASRKLRPALAICVVLIAGLFTKLSFLPALAVIPGWRALRFVLRANDTEPRAWVEFIRGLIVDTLLFVVLPLAVFFGYQYCVGSLELYAHEFDRMATLDSSALYHVLCLIQLFAIPAVLMWLRDRETSTREWMLVGWVALYVASLWYAATSGWGRFYLPVLPVVVVLAAPGLSRIRAVSGPAMVWSFVAIAAFLNYAAMQLRLYY